MLDGGIIQRLLEEKWKTFARVSVWCFIVYIMFILSLQSIFAGTSWLAPFSCVTLTTSKLYSGRNINSLNIILFKIKETLSDQFGITFFLKFIYQKYIGNVQDTGSRHTGAKRVSLHNNNDGEKREKQSEKKRLFHDFVLIQKISNLYVTFDYSSMLLFEWALRDNSTVKWVMYRSRRSVIKSLKSSLPRDETKAPHRVVTIEYRVSLVDESCSFWSDSPFSPFTWCRSPWPFTFGPRTSTPISWSGPRK